MECEGKTRVNNKIQPSVALKKPAFSIFSVSKVVSIMGFGGL
jgi:hypothetical protein